MVVIVPGDGNCLLHSLSYANQHDGGALRIEVVNFLRDQAAHQEGFEDAWRREATTLLTVAAAVA